MGRAKEIVLKVIPAKIANDFVRKWHYSGKVVNNSSLHFGCFLDNELHGVMSYGSPLDKRKVLPLVHTAENEPVLWNEMLELNRMAFDDILPKNAESRCIAISIKLLKKNAPHIKWILSFSDATQCGDGTIYRASGFCLTGIKIAKDSYTLPKGESYTAITMKLHGYAGTITEYLSKADFYKYLGSTANMVRFDNMMQAIGAKRNEGFQIRYILLIDKTCKITVPILPFSKITELNAGMYKGEKR